MIKEIKEALDKATPGKWDFAVFEDSRHIIFDNTLLNRHIAEIVRGGVESEQREEDNAHLIANAPEWLHYLIGEVERLQIIEKQYKELTSIMDRARNVAIQESDNEEDKPLFWMDADGNLHRRTEKP